MQKFITVRMWEETKEKLDITTTPFMDVLNERKKSYFFGTSN